MIDPNTLRGLVREIIAAEVSVLRAGLGAGNAGPAQPQSPAEVEAAIATDADLRAFAREVLLLAEDAPRRQAILAGRFPFRLSRAGSVVASASASLQPIPGAQRIEKGVVSEALLNKLPKGISRLVLGPDVAITPLARERARKLNISIERIQP